jgi:lysophospholipase
MRLIALARNPVPSGAVVGTFKGYDGAPLRFARWEATRTPRRGTVCVFTGRGEFIEKYFEVVADLRRRGYAVAIMDWRGQGGSHRSLSNRRKGHIWSFTEYDKDLARFMKEIVLPDCPPPFIALGHSMAGNILLRNAVVPSSWFTRMILTAPMIAFADEKIGFPQPVARAYAFSLSLIGFGRSYVMGGCDAPVESGPFEDNPVTSDRERYLRNRLLVESAPELALGSPTIAWLRAAYRSSRRLLQVDYPLSVAVPLLLFAAGNDHIVAPQPIEEFALRLKVGTHVLLPQSRHEILQENDEIRSCFWAAFDAYLGVNAAAA